MSTGGGQTVIIKLHQLEVHWFEMAHRHANFLAYKRLSGATPFMKIMYIVVPLLKEVEDKKTESQFRRTMFGIFCAADWSWKNYSLSNDALETNNLSPPNRTWSKQEVAGTYFISPGKFRVYRAQNSRNFD